MSTDNYYKKTWTEPNNHGTLFWENVDFSKKEYKYQEMVFRDYLRGLKDKDKIKSVLELGMGNGRMTKILFEELSSIKRYRGIDIEFYEGMFTSILKNKGDVKVSMDKMDITGQEFDERMRGTLVDLIVASEVFMHIKPQDIQRVLKFLCRMARGNNASIINIDWAFDRYESEWCFIHPYTILYTYYGGLEVEYIPMEDIKQALWHYKFGA